MIALVFLLAIVVIVIIIFAASYSHAAKESNYRNAILTVDNTGLQLQIDKKTEELKTAKGQISSLKSKIDELESQKDNWVSHIETLQKEAENKNILLSNLEETIKELQKENERLDALKIKEYPDIEEKTDFVPAYQDEQKMEQNTAGNVIIKQELPENLFNDLKEDIGQMFNHSALKIIDALKTKPNIQSKQLCIDDIFFEPEAFSEETQEFDLERKNILLKDIDAMKDGYTFEYFVASIFKAFGYSVKITKAAKDFGVDVVAFNDIVRIGIQCKISNGEKLAMPAVQEIVAGRNYYNLDKGMIVTNTYFYKTAVELAMKNKICLWDRDKLYQKTLEAQEKVADERKEIADTGGME